MRTTVRDVAREAGVSHRTVVNVLNGRQGEASAQTQERVLTAARKLNYIPVAQPAAQHRHVETRVIGLVFEEGDWGNVWGLRTFQGLREGARKHEYDLLTILRESPDWATDRQQLRFLDRRSDGLIFMTPQDRTDAFNTLLEHEIPVVSCYMDNVPEGIAHVTVDNRSAMREAARYLVSMGHQRILHLTSTQVRSDFQHRLEGYLDVMKENALKPHYLKLNMKAEWVPQVLHTVKEGDFTALLCVSDSLACALWPHLREAGLNIPENISVLGMDDEEYAAPMGLTTIRISGVEVGHLAVDSMVAMIRGGSAAENSKFAAHQLIYRSSVADLNAPQYKAPRKKVLTLM